MGPKINILMLLNWFPHLEVVDFIVFDTERLQGDPVDPPGSELNAATTASHDPPVQLEK